MGGAVGGWLGDYPTGAKTSIRYRNHRVEYFDHKEHRYRTGYSYTKAQKRIFHKTFSGLQVGFHKGQMLIFLTLTTEYMDKKAALERAEEEMNQHWQKLRKNIDYNVQKWRFEQIFTVNYGPPNPYTKEGRKFYRERRKNWMYDSKHTVWEHCKFRLCYMKVRTSEGGGVLHVLIRKDRSIPIIAQQWLKQEWDRLHGAEQVWIEEIKVKNNNLQGAMDASFYFCGNYFNQQPVVRQSSSWNWIFRGSQSSWARGKKILGIKPKLVELEPFTYADDVDNDIKITTKHEKTNVIGYRKSIIAVFMESRKSLRCDSGYNNALTYWLTLTRNPPKSSYQKKLANVRLGAITYAYT